jgi:hypothetical protein
VKNQLFTVKNNSATLILKSAFFPARRHFFAGTVEAPQWQGMDDADDEDDDKNGEDDKDDDEDNDEDNDNDDDTVLVL